MVVMKGLKVFTIAVLKVCLYRAWKECHHFTGIRDYCEVQPKFTITLQIHGLHFTPLPC